MFPIFTMWLFFYHIYLLEMIVLYSIRTLTNSMFPIITIWLIFTNLYAEIF